MKADPRGFLFDLQPALTRQQWRVERAHAHLVAARRAESEAADARAMLARQLDEQQSLPGAAAVRRLDVSMLQRNLQWFAAQHANLGRLDAQAMARKSEREAAAARWARELAKREAFEQHRADELATFLGTAKRRGMMEADDDWLLTRGRSSAQIA